MTYDEYEVVIESYRVQPDEEVRDCRGSNPVGIAKYNEVEERRREYDDG